MYQTTFSLVDDSSEAFSDFIESSSNKLAYQYIQNWPTNFGILPYNKALIIRGPKSSGKSLLANLWVKKTNALFIKKHYELTNSILEYHETFAIDGFDASWPEEKMLHYFNILHENNKYMLITLTQMPEIKLADLSSRLSAINKVDILPLDDELMKVLIFKQFSKFSIIVNDEVINYLVKVLPREFPKVLKAIELLNLFSLESKRKITVPFVKEKLKEIISPEN